MSSITTNAPDIAAIAPRAGLARMYWQLTKARLSALVLLTTAIGVILGSPAATGIDWAGVDCAWHCAGGGVCKFVQPTS